MEEKIINMNQFLGAAQGDQEHMLGKFLYFSLANLLVDKDELSELCDSMDIPYSGGNRLSVSDAFRSATGDIRERVPVTENGETNIYLAYCRDNKRTAEILSSLKNICSVRQSPTPCAPKARACAASFGVSAFART